jgi:hypothetical protein
LFSVSRKTERIERRAFFKFAIASRSIEGDTVISLTGNLIVVVALVEIAVRNGRPTSGSGWPPRFPRPWLATV